jgi:hypothetical protein
MGLTYSFLPTRVLDTYSLMIQAYSQISTFQSHYGYYYSFSSYFLYYLVEHFIPGPRRNPLANSSISWNQGRNNPTRERDQHAYSR